MSNKDIKSKIERALSDILSDKHNCKVIVKFEKYKGADLDGDKDTTRIVIEEQILDRKTPIL